MSGSPPNVVVIMADQMKATASQLYGARPQGSHADGAPTRGGHDDGANEEFVRHASCATPSLERLAREGVLFEHAYTPQPLCVPARVSLWSGRYPHSTGARRNETPMPADVEHAFRLWHRAGFDTALIGKNHCFESEDDRALFDTWCEIGHDGLPERDATRGMPWFRPTSAIEEAHQVRRSMPRQSEAVSWAVSDYPLEDYSTGLVAGQTARYLEERAREPFALWVSFPDPHTPYEAPRHYFDEQMSAGVEVPASEHYEMPGAPERNRVLRRLLDISDAHPADQQALVATYLAMVRFVDDGVGQVLDALERTGLRENTIVVFCSDHGDFAGEHGMTRKGGVFYDCLTRVPLLVSWPASVTAGVREESFVSLVDLVPTLLRLQGLPVPRSMQGTPLPSVTNEPPRDAVFAEYGAGGPPFREEDLAALPQQHGLEASRASLQWREAEGRRKMVRTREWKYVTDPMGDLDELYDMEADPQEHHNLANQPEHEVTVQEMRSRLLEWSILTEDARPVPLPVLAANGLQSTSTGHSADGGAPAASSGDDDPPPTGPDERTM